MNEKPFHLPMPFGEALSRLARAPKKNKHLEVAQSTPKAKKRNKSAAKPKQ